MAAYWGRQWHWVKTPMVLYLPMPSYCPQNQRNKDKANTTYIVATEVDCCLDLNTWTSNLFHCMRAHGLFTGLIHHMIKFPWPTAVTWPSLTVTTPVTSHSEALLKSAQHWYPWRCCRQGSPPMWWQWRWQAQQRSHDNSHMMTMTKPRRQPSGGDGEDDKLTVAASDKTTAAMRQGWQKKQSQHYYTYHNYNNLLGWSRKHG